MDLSNISLLRLQNQKIAQQTFQKPDEVLSWLGAIQGQDYTGAKWSIGLRMIKTTDTEIENALINKEILRTWLMRGTLHMVGAKDIGWIQPLFAPRIIQGNARRYKELELDTSTLLKSNEIITKALFKQKQLNRKELLSCLEQNKISTKGQRAAYMLQRACYDGLICQTNTVKNTPNYVLLDEIKSDKKTLTREEAIAELTRRYFTSRGPVTLQDFVWWSGLTVSDARTGLLNNKPLLKEETIEGRAYWLPIENSVLLGQKPTVRLLPGFDEFLLGYKDRMASLDPEYNTRWCPGNNGMFFPFVIINGRVEGIWKRTLKKDNVLIEINSFNSKTVINDKAFIDAASHYSKFVQMKLLSTKLI
jgi:hypothetical protein